MFAGFFIITIGILIILQQLEIITGNFWGYVWGAAVILIGLSFLSKKGHSWCCGPKKSKEVQ